MNSRARINRNKNIAIIRTKNRRNSSIKNWIIDHFWPVEEWPDHIVNSLIDFKYTDRICICNFLYGNGLQLQDAFKLIAFYHNWDIHTKNCYEYTFTKLWLRLNEAVQKQHWDYHRITSTYYFYSMISRRVMYFDGTIRLNGVKINVVQNSNIVNPVRVPHDNAVDLLELSQILGQLVRTPVDYRIERDRQDRLNRRWSFLASLDGNPLIIDGYTFKFDFKLYTNAI